jgi:hypothetical protein
VATATYGMAVLVVERDSVGCESLILRRFNAPFVHRARVGAADKESERVHINVRATTVSVHTLAGDMIGSFDTSNAIVACDVVYPGDERKLCWLVLLTEVNELIVLAFSEKGPSKKSAERLEYKFVIIKHFQFEDTLMKRRRLQSIDYENMKKYIVVQDCFMSIDQSSRFIYIHSCRGFLTALELLPSKIDLYQQATENRLPRGTQKTPGLLSLQKFKVFETPRNFFIGNNLVIDVQSYADGWLHIITRNINLSYELNFYKVEKKKNGLTMNQDHTLSISFDDKPNLLIPSKYFSILLFEKSQTVYLRPELDLIFAGELGDNFEVGDASLTFKLDFKSGINENFITYTRIDDFTMVLVTESMKTFILRLEFEYKPSPYELYIQQSKRTRSNAVEYSNSSIVINRWFIKQMSSLTVTDAEKALQLTDAIMQDLQKIAVQQKFHVDLSSQNLSKVMINIPKDCSKTSIAHLSTYNGALYYTKSSKFKSEAISPEFNLVMPKISVKRQTQLGPFTIFLVELPPSLESPMTGSDEGKQRLDIFLSNGKLISSYDFEAENSVTAITPLKEFKPFIPDSNDFLTYEVRGLTDSLKYSFMVITSNSNYDGVGIYDDDEDDGYQQGVVSEVMLFTITEDQQLELASIAILNYKITCIDQIDNRNVILWGPRMQFNMGLQVYRQHREDDNNERETHSEEEDRKLQFKFIITRKQVIDAIGNISFTEELKAGYWLLVDKFTGIYITRINLNTNLVVKPKLAFGWKLISAINVFSEDIVIAGDNLGNIFVFNVAYLKKVPRFEILTKFNLQTGSITSIGCYSPDTESEKVKLCSVGTSEGSISTIQLYADEKSKQLQAYISENLKKQIDMAATKIEKVSTGKIVNFKELNHTSELLILSSHLQHLLDERFVKTSLLSDTCLDIYSGKEDLTVFNV